MSSLTVSPDTRSDEQTETKLMQSLLNFATRTKLMFGFGLMLLFLALVVVTSYTAITTLRSSLYDLYEEEFTSVIDLRTLRSNQNAIRADLLLMISAATAEQQETWLQDIQELTRTNEQLVLDLLEDAQYNPDLHARLEELGSLQRDFQTNREEEIIPLITVGSTDEAREIILGIQEERNQQMRTLTEELITTFDQQATQALAEAGQRADLLITLFIIVGLVALLTGIGLALLLERVIANPLRAIAGVAERVGSGDLTVNVPSMRRADEVGTLAHMFRRMVDALRELNREVRDGVTVLTGSTGEIVAATTQLAVGTAETATAVSQTTTTVEEVRQVAEVASQKARNVLDNAQKSVQIAETGRKSVEETVQGMQRIQGQMELIADSIVRLSEQSQAIGEIIATVADLSEQSNLLAVNAAIEAAKAGEQGRGFAVVAQEVRSLAEQSKQATTQVRTILNDIQKATSSAVMATEQGGRAVEAGVRQSGEAGEAIRLLADVITDAAQAATQIAASSQQQVVGMSQVAQAMENINQAGSQNAASTRQAEAIARDLHGLGLRLKQLIEQYNL